MTTHDPLTRFGPRVPTPQTRKADPRQERNAAGGYTFVTDEFSALRRFLILGTTGGTYYVSERELTGDAVAVVTACLAKDPVRTLAMVREVSVGGLAFRQQPTLFTLAAASAMASDVDVRRHALAMLPEVCRIGTHLFQFVGYVEQFRGWGPMLRRAIADWYLTKTPRALEREVSKYKSRYGWSHRDLLRLAKPRPERGSEHDQIFAWVVGKGPGTEYLQTIDALPEMNSEALIGTVAGWRLPWEVLPSEKLRDADLWEAQLGHLGLTALIRNLGRLTDLGVVRPMDLNAEFVAGRLTNAENVAGARIHPMQVLLAEAIYRRGEGDKGKLSWHPVPEILEALDAAFDLSFVNVEPAGKRTMVAMDVSGSMSQRVMGTPLSAAEAAAALALIIARTEPKVYSLAFADHMIDFPITKRDSVADICRRARSVNFGRTDCAQPMIVARERKVPVDTFVVITDNETWYGQEHPHEALHRYRREMNIDAKMVVVALTATSRTIADPADPGMLDTVGLDASLPRLIAEFSAGRV